MQSSKELQQGITELRNIALSIPYLSKKHIDFLRTLQIIDERHYAIYLHHSQTIFSEEQNLAKEALNQDLQYILLSATKERKHDAIFTYKMLFDILALLISKVICKQYIKDKIANFLDKNLYDYLFKSSLKNPNTELQIFLEKIFNEQPNKVLTNENIDSTNLLLIHGHPQILKMAISRGIQPFAPMSTGASLIDHLKKTHNYLEIERLLILLIKYNLKNFNTILPVDLYQNMVFINNQLQFIAKQGHPCSTKLKKLINKANSKESITKLTTLAQASPNIVNRWLFKQMLDLLHTRQVHSNNWMFNLALFINPEHSYLALDAISHGANPLSQVIKIHNNQFVSFCDILISYNRVGELAQILNYYQQLYQGYLQGPKLINHLQHCDFATKLVSFLLENYEYTPNNAENVLMTLFEFLAKYDPQAADVFNNLEINPLYTAIIDNIKHRLYTQDTHSQDDYKFATFIKDLLITQPDNLLKNQLMQLLNKLQMANASNQALQFTKGKAKTAQDMQPANLIIAQEIGQRIELNF